MSETHSETQMGHDQIRADRACAGCGFNLYGQSVTKEAHYGLAIARCPECGTVAALQQYPAMTHWVNRFRLILGAIYVVMLLAVFVASTIGISAFAFAGSRVASANLGQYLIDDYNTWTAEKEAEQAAQTAPAALQVTMPQLPGLLTSWSSNLSPEYMAFRLKGALDEFGSQWGNMNREWIIIMIPASIVSGAIGVFWSTALLGASRRRALLVPLASCLIGGAFIIGANSPDNTNPWTWDYAHQLYIPMMTPVILAIEFIALAFGIYVGRMFARFVVRLALPPRARVPLGILWARDGLEMPRP
ncbi:MAG: hypothetical protein JJ916_03770 [Phycisphaerales bacterium]|nr:hypothetical protein [Phycisphaerales bacterium]